MELKRWLNKEVVVPTVHGAETRDVRKADRRKLNELEKGVREEWHD